MNFRIKKYLKFVRKVVQHSYQIIVSVVQKLNLYNENNRLPTKNTSKMINKLLPSNSFTVITYKVKCFISTVFYFTRSRKSQTCSKGARLRSKTFAIFEQFIKNNMIQDQNLKNNSLSICLITLPFLFAKHYAPNLFV